MGLGDFLEGLVDKVSSAAENVDWEAVGKVAAGVAGAAAVGGTAYYVGKQVGHTDGAKDGYARASDEYATKFEQQEQDFRDREQRTSTEIEEIMKSLRWNSSSNS